MIPAIALIKTPTGKVTQLFTSFTAVLVEISLKLNYCELDRAIAFLNEQYAVGKVEIKVV